MSHSKKYIKRQPSKEFGDYLRTLREQKTDLNQSQAAQKIGLSPEQLNYFEQGTRAPSDSILIKFAQLYRLPPDEVLRQAYWPQLILLPLIAIINPDQLSENLIKELEKGLEEKERQELTKQIENLLRKRSKVKQR